MVTTSFPSENGCENNADGQGDVEHYETQGKAKRIKIENDINADVAMQQLDVGVSPHKMEAEKYTPISNSSQSSNAASNPSDFTAGEASAVSMRVQPSALSTVVTHQSSNVENSPTKIANRNLESKIKTEPIQMKKQQTPPPPLKSTTMSHLRKKYMTELEYMHREFKKLEKQLLGAKTCAKNSADEFASRERRDKLHSFIMHLESTMKEIRVGCSIEEKCKQNASTTKPQKESFVPTYDEKGSVDMSLNKDDEAAKKEFANSSALTKLTKEKEAEENVQKLEEHILANLLPVKVRLTKQLAAQQGASRNPAGMPLSRRGMQTSNATEKGKGTFAAAAEQKRLAQIHLQQQQQDDLTSKIGPLHPSGIGPVTGPTAHSQFGKPLQGGGSSLTQKLHGSTLGSKNRPSGHGVGYDSDKNGLGPTEAQGGIHNKSGNPKQKKIQYAGMTPGSTQIQSGVCAAKGIHDMMIESSTNVENVVPTLLSTSHLNENGSTLTGGEQIIDRVKINVSETVPAPSDNSVKSMGRNVIVQNISSTVKTPQQNIDASGPTRKSSPIPSQMPPPEVKSSIKNSHHPQVNSSKTPTSMTPISRPAKKSLKDPNLSEEERRKIKERRKERKLEKRRAHMLEEKERQKQLIAQQQAASLRQVKAMSHSRNTTLHSKGPRNVEYICALCNETYTSTCEYNPWWALTSHECLKCGKTQIPRLDISAPNNAIEYHPALLAHAAVDDNVSSEPNNVLPISALNMKTAQFLPKQSNIPSPHTLSANTNLIVKNSDQKGVERSDDELSTSDSDDSENDESLSPSAQAENEDFGLDYSGPKFTDYDSSRLLALISHASTCPGQHKNSKAHNICLSTKYLMLHVRDCPGTTSSYDICPYPWCRKTKHLLYHLVSCISPEKCPICSPKDLAPSFTALGALNKHRNTKHKQRMCIPVPSKASSSTPESLSIPPLKKKMSQDNRSSNVHSTTIPVAETKRTTTKKSTQGVRRSHGAVLINRSGMTTVLPSPSLSNKILSVPSPLPENNSVKREEPSTVTQVVKTPRTANISVHEHRKSTTSQVDSVAHGPNFPVLPSSLPTFPTSKSKHITTNITQLKTRKLSNSPMAIVSNGMHSISEGSQIQNTTEDQTKKTSSPGENKFSGVAQTTSLPGGIPSSSHHSSIELNCDNKLNNDLQAVEVSDEARCSNGSNGSNSSDSSNSFNDTSRPLQNLASNNANVLVETSLSH